MEPTRKPAAGATPAREGASSAAAVDWTALVQGIRYDSLSAGLEFKECHRSGVTIFLRRHLGTVGLGTLVEEVLEGALREITCGRMTTPGDLVHFLRNVLERELLIRNVDPARSLLALVSATDHSRLNHEAALVKSALAAFTDSEQRALRGYYEGNLSSQQAAMAAGLGSHEFPVLRSRLYQAVRSMEPVEDTAPVRAFAAGSRAH